MQSSTWLKTLTYYNTPTLKTSASPVNTREEKALVKSQSIIKKRKRGGEKKQHAIKKKESKSLSVHSGLSIFTVLKSLNYSTMERERERER